MCLVGEANGKFLATLLIELPGEFGHVESLLTLM